LKNELKNELETNKENIDFKRRRRLTIAYNDQDEDEKREEEMSQDEDTCYIEVTHVLVCTCRSGKRE
jgi:hypothetical protein